MAAATETQRQNTITCGKCFFFDKKGVDGKPFKEIELAEVGVLAVGVCRVNCGLVYGVRHEMAVCSQKDPRSFIQASKVPPSINLNKLNPESKRKLIASYHGSNGAPKWPPTNLAG